MNENCYVQQRRDGAKQIAKAAEKMADSVGINLERIEWDKERGITDTANHELAVSANGKTITGQFPDEWLADYPGYVGTEKANRVLSEMIRKLVG
jgi:hypothetical protein